MADQFPTFKARAAYFAEQNVRLLANINDPGEPGVGGRHLLSPVTRQKVERILHRVRVNPRLTGHAPSQDRYGQLSGHVRMVWDSAE